jgi:hypothetical protein
MRKRDFLHLITEPNENGEPKEDGEAKSTKIENFIYFA